MKTKSACSIAAFAACAIGAWTVLAHPGAPTAQAQNIPILASPAGPSLLGKKLVWAHSMISYPLDLNVLYPYKPQGYSELYPLYQEQGLEQRTGKRWQAQDIQAAKNAGVDGFSPDIFSDASGALYYLQAADQVGGFLIAPCLDLSTTAQEKKEDMAFQVVDDYCRLAASHPSAARINGAYIVFTYGTEQIPVEGWKRVRRRLADAGDKTYWIAAVVLGSQAEQAKGFPAALVMQYSNIFEAGYCFGPPGGWWNDLVALFQKSHRPFMGGMMPSYNRAGAGNWDAEGTAQYRAQWQRYLSSTTPWAIITTWNDLQEGTDVFPSSDWNFTRSDLTRWYSAKFKGEREHWTEPQLYVSAPKTAYPGEQARAEALVLNPLAHPITASIQFFDAQKKPVGAPVTASIPAGEAQAATQLLSLAAFPPGSFLRAHAVLSENGRQIASVVSAPVLVLDPQAQPGFPTVYYSIPAIRALPAPVQVTRQGDQVNSVFPARVQRRFAEVLHNTALVKNDLRGRTISQRLPSQPDTGMVTQYTTWGFDVARVTDDLFRVGYSDPLYTAPPRLLTLKEKYNFDEGADTEITDLSPYHQTSKLIDVGWAKPGYGGSPACAYFNGRSSRIDLTVGQTPEGPVSWKLAVRPSAFGSTLYADVGGFIVNLGKDGKIQFSRHTPGGFVVVYGATPLVIGAWSQIQCTWDGKTSRLFINGHLDGQTLCGGGFGSGRRSLGCNPFGQSSDYYNGDMDDFEISTKLP